MAHEVKNPLSGIRGAAQLLEDTAKSAENIEMTILADDFVRGRPKMGADGQLNADDLAMQGGGAALAVILRSISAGWPMNLGSRRPFSADEVVGAPRAWLRTIFKCGRFFFRINVIGPGQNFL